MDSRFVDSLCLYVAGAFGALAAASVALGDPMACLLALSASGVSVLLGRD